MIASALIGMAAALSPSCSIGDYISVCNFTPPETGAFRIISETRAAAKGPGPHTLTSEYVINGMHCRQLAGWRSGVQIVRANCVARLIGGTYYHVVATTNAQNADHLGQVLITVAPTDSAPTLNEAPVSIRIKTPGD